MTALNMWLYNLDAEIYHGDSLTQKFFHVWKIRKGGFIYEAEVKEEEQPLPKLVIKEMKEKAKQESLFDLEEVD